MTDFVFTYHDLSRRGRKKLNTHLTKQLRLEGRLLPTEIFTASEFDMKVDVVATSLVIENEYQKESENE